MEFISSLVYFILVVGILVFIHEFGHFIAARISRMRVDVFAIGMGFRLFGWNKKTGFTFGKLPDDFDGEGNTDYRLSAFPIGGYVKIAGMIDESMDTDFVQSEPKPYEFRAKNAFLKAFTISAGVIMNAILAVAIFTFIAVYQGSYHNGTTSVGYVEKNSIAEQIGLKVGDRVLAVNENKVFTWQEMLEQMIKRDLGTSKRVEINRDGRNLILSVDGDRMVQALGNAKPLGLAPFNQYVFLNSVETLKRAGKAGLKDNDTILSINSEPIKTLTQFVRIISSNKEKQVQMVCKRRADTLTLAVTPDAQGLIGVGIAEGFTGPIIHKTYDLFSAISLGTKETYNASKDFFDTFKQIFKGNISAKQSLGGPILIAKSAAQRAELGIVSFLHFVALLSITLAVVNILPIPALDGGHLLFIIIEAIIRREVPIKIKMLVQQIGLGIIILLMVFMFYNDISRVFGL